MQRERIASIVMKSEAVQDWVTTCKSIPPRLYSQAKSDQGTRTAKKKVELLLFGRALAYTRFVSWNSHAGKITTTSTWIIGLTG